jgi:hypothetical protein
MLSAYGQGKARVFFVLRKEPKDFYFSAASTYPAMARICTLAPKQKSFASFLPRIQL